MLSFAPPPLVSLIEMPFSAVTVRPKVFDRPEKIAKKNQKNMKFGGIEDSHVRKARAHFHAVRTLRELVSKENINFVRMRAVN